MQEHSHNHSSDEEHEHQHEGGGGHHAHMMHDFQKRFWISLVVTIPILVLSPMIQSFIGIRGSFILPVILLYHSLCPRLFMFMVDGPFLKGLVDELKQRQPGMMTLIAIAITVAYAYSAVVVFGVSGRVFFWELATLIDIMLRTLD